MQSSPADPQTSVSTTDVRSIATKIANAINSIPSRPRAPVSRERCFAEVNKVLKYTISAVSVLSERAFHSVWLLYQSKKPAALLSSTAATLEETSAVTDFLDIETALHIGATVARHSLNFHFPKANASSLKGQTRADLPRTSIDADETQTIKAAINIRHITGVTDLIDAVVPELVADCVRGRRTLFFDDFLFIVIRMEWASRISRQSASLALADRALTLIRFYSDASTSESVLSFCTALKKDFFNPSKLHLQINTAEKRFVGLNLKKNSPPVQVNDALFEALVLGPRLFRGRRTELIDKLRKEFDSHIAVSKLQSWVAVSRMLPAVYGQCDPWALACYVRAEDNAFCDVARFAEVITRLHDVFSRFYCAAENPWREEDVPRAALSSDLVATAGCRWPVHVPIKNLMLIAAAAQGRAASTHHVKAALTVAELLEWLRWTNCEYDSFCAACTASGKPTLLHPSLRVERAVIEKRAAADLRSTAKAKALMDTLYESYPEPPNDTSIHFREYCAALCALKSPLFRVAVRAPEFEALVATQLEEARKAYSTRQLSGAAVSSLICRVTERFVNTGPLQYRAVVPVERVGASLLMLSTHATDGSAETAVSELCLIRLSAIARLFCSLRATLRRLDQPQGESPMAWSLVDVVDVLRGSLKWGLHHEGIGAEDLCASVGSVTDDTLVKLVARVVLPAQVPQSELDLVLLTKELHSNLLHVTFLDGIALVEAMYCFAVAYASWIASDAAPGQRENTLTLRSRLEFPEECSIAAAEVSELQSFFLALRVHHPGQSFFPTATNKSSHAPERFFEFLLDQDVQRRLSRLQGTFRVVSALRSQQRLSTHSTAVPIVCGDVGHILTDCGVLSGSFAELWRASPSETLLGLLGLSTDRPAVVNEDFLLIWGHKIDHWVKQAFNASSGSFPQRGGGGLVVPPVLEATPDVGISAAWIPLVDARWFEGAPRGAEKLLWDPDLCLRLPSSSDDLIRLCDFAQMLRRLWNPNTREEGINTACSWAAVALRVGFLGELESPPHSSLETVRLRIADVLRRGLMTLDKDADGSDPETTPYVSLHNMLESLLCTDFIFASPDVEDPEDLGAWQNALCWCDSLSAVVKTIPEALLPSAANQRYQGIPLATDLRVPPECAAPCGVLGADEAHWVLTHILQGILNESNPTKGLAGQVPSACSWGDFRPLLYVAEQSVERYALLPRHHGREFGRCFATDLSAWKEPVTISVMVLRVVSVLLLRAAHVLQQPSLQALQLFVTETFMVRYLQTDSAQLEAAVRRWVSDAFPAVSDQVDSYVPLVDALHFVGDMFVLLAELSWHSGAMPPSSARFFHETIDSDHDSGLFRLVHALSTGIQPNEDAENNLMTGRDPFAFGLRYWIPGHFLELHHAIEMTREHGLMRRDGVITSGVS